MTKLRMLVNQLMKNEDSKGGLGEMAAFALGAGVLATLGKLLAAGPSGLARVASTKTQDTPVEVSVVRIIGRPPSVKLAVMASPRGSENPIRLFSSFRQKVRLVGWPIL